MDEAAKDQSILRRVGRPRKVASVEEFISMPVIEPVTLEPVMLEPDTKAKAQEYADRVWAGQSISEHTAWRVQRVREALAGQNLPCDGVIVGGVKL